MKVSRCIILLETCGRKLLWNFFKAHLKVLINFGKTYANFGIFKVVLKFWENILEFSRKSWESYQECEENVRKLSQILLKNPQRFQSKISRDKKLSLISQESSSKYLSVSFLPSLKFNLMWTQPTSIFSIQKIMNWHYFYGKQMEKKEVKWWSLPAFKVKNYRKVLLSGKCRLMEVERPKLSLVFLFDFTFYCNLMNVVRAVWITKSPRVFANKNLWQWKVFILLFFSSEAIFFLLSASTAGNQVFTIRQRFL